MTAVENNAVTSVDYATRAAQEWDVIQRRVPYESSLRSIGAILDGYAAVGAHVMEVRGGFILRYGRGHDAPGLLTESLTYADALSRTREARRRRHSPFRLGRKRAVNSRYEDAFRALGHELDEAKAYCLLVDEVGDGFLVTYQFLKPSEGFMVRKRMVFLDGPSIDKVVNGARGRRASLKIGVFSSLAS